MGVILLEALAALVILVFIVWWTMFSGRPKGEPPAHQKALTRQAHDVESAKVAAASDGPAEPTTPPPPRDKA